MAGGQKPKDQDEGESVSSSAISDNEAKLYPQSVLSRILTLLAMLIFTAAAVAQAYLSQTLYDTYNTQMSVTESFELVKTQLHDTTSNDIDQFWIWIAFLGLEIKQEDSEGYMKLSGGPDYFASDILITTRRMKETENEKFPEMKQWVATKYNPFLDPHDDNIFDTEPIVIDSTGTTIEHSIEGSYKDLGGFTFSIPIDLDQHDFLERIKWLQDPENGFVNSKTISVVANIIFYNKKTLSFVFIALKVIRSPGGYLHYEFEYNRPIGQLLDVNTHGWIEIIEWTHLALVAAYLVTELIIFILLLIRYLGQKKKKNELDHAKFMDYRNSILALYPPSNVTVSLKEEADQEEADEVTKQNLVMFYWSEGNNQKLTEPSFINAFKITVRREQRIFMYLVCLLLIPINIYHGDWHVIYDGHLYLKDITFEDIVNRDSTWRQDHSDYFILNDFILLNFNEDIMLIFQTLFLFFIVARMLFLLSTFSKKLYQNLVLLGQIYNFLKSFVITLLFVMLAWVMCQHLIFGSQMPAFANLQNSFVSTVLLALRDFTFLDQMFKLQPNITVVFFIFFTVSIMLFFAFIFVSFVMVVYGEIAQEMIEKKKRNNEQELRDDEHWSFKVSGCFANTKNACLKTKCCNSFAKCCCKKKEQKKERSIEDMIERPADGRQQPKPLQKMQKQKKVGFEDDDDESDAPDDSEDSAAEKKDSGSESGSKSDDSEENSDKEDESQDENSEDTGGRKNKDKDSDKKKKKKDNKKKKGKKSDESEEETAVKEKLRPGQVVKKFGRKKIVFENVDAMDMQSMRMTENDDKERAIIPQRRTRVTEIFDDSDSEEDPQYSDSDISMADDFDNVDDMTLVKAKARRRLGTRSAADGRSFHSQEQKSQLKKMQWNRDFEVYDLDADLQQDLRHTSNKQDEFMIKQREQRCGKVIWKTLVQLLYMGLYLFVIFDRNNIKAMQEHNHYIEQIFRKTRYEGDDGNVIMFEEIDFSSFEKVIQFLELMDKNLLKEKKTDITNELDTTATRTSELYYFGNEKNYIVLQGSTYCIDMQETSPYFEGKKQVKFAATYANTLKASFDQSAFHQTGGLCFAIFAQDEGVPTETLKEVVDILLDDPESNREVIKLSYTLLVGEPVLNMLTRIYMEWEIAESGHITFNLTTTSRVYKILVSAIILQIIFVAFFILNLYIFCTSEHDIYKRMKAWNRHNIDSLQKFERDKREKKRPQIFRTLGIFFRAANIAYFAHITLTIYSELLYTISFLKLTEIVNELANVPGTPVLDNLFDLDDLKIISRESRQQFQFTIVQLFNEYLDAATVYRQWAILNLFLIVVQPLTSASQSSRFRAFLSALGQTMISSIFLFLVLFLFSISVLFYSIHSFGYISDDFQTFSYTSMTIWKMMVGRLVGTYYQVALSINAYKAMFFTLPIVLMKATFLTVFLAVVSYQYEDEVLNKDFSSNINILRSIIFCNISLEKRQKNKRTKMLEETEAMKEMGNEGGHDDAEDDADEEDNGEMGLGGMIEQDGVKVVNGGLEIYNKLDIKFVIQRKIPEWAMACADDIRQEKANRRNLRNESIQLAQKLFLRSENAQVTNARKEKQNETNQINSFNLMVARKDYITYIWFGIQFFYMQGQLIQKVIESLENEIKTMVKPYMQGKQQETYLKLLQKQQGAPKTDAKEQKFANIELKNPITNRVELVTMEHLSRQTLQEERNIQSDVKEYLLELIELIETRLQRIRKQWRILMLQSKQKRILEAISKKENLFK